MFTEHAFVEPSPAGQEVTRGRVLLIDDDDDHLNALAALLRQRDFDARTSVRPERAEETYAEYWPDAVVLDVNMPGMDGLEVLARLRARDAAAGIILLSAHLDVPTTVRALRLGVDDVLTKPVEVPQLLDALDRAVTRVRDTRMQRAISFQSDAATDYFDASPLMARAFRALQVAAGAHYAVMLVGETGTGKACAARIVHRLSARADGPFVRLDCTATDEELRHDLAVDASGRPTGAPSLVDRAVGGTLLLSEPGRLSPALQGVLETALQRRDHRGDRERGARPSLRLITATTIPLDVMVDRGEFDIALHRRIAEVPITLPPLRVRGPEGVSDLATRLLQRHQSRLGRGPTRFAPEALQRLVRYPWPGNVRELRNVIECAFPFALDRDEVGAGDLPDLGAGEGYERDEGPSADPEVLTLAEVERRHVSDVLSRVGGNRVAAARLLGISRSTLYMKIAAMGLEEVREN